MKSFAKVKIYQGLQQKHRFPAISLILDFNPKMDNKRTLITALRAATRKVGNELYERFADDMASLVMQKLRLVLSNLDFSTHTISIAVYVSPFFEKVLYLDFAVEEKVMVSDSFQLRDLLFAKRATREYLVLFLATEKSTIYIGDPNSLVKLLSNTAQSAYLYEPGSTAKAGGKSSEQEDDTPGKYLRYIDTVLEIILKAYPLPLFIIANASIISQFQSLTHHARAAIKYLQSDQEKMEQAQVRQILQPHIADWSRVKEQQLFNQLEEAVSTKKLATGLDDVWQAAVHHGGHLLVIEKDQVYNTKNKSLNRVIQETIIPFNNFSCIKNQVDESIEKVLDYGGSVEFVDKDVLRSYDHIALVK